jgi:hypothetical protein
MLPFRGSSKSADPRTAGTALSPGIGACLIGLALYSSIRHNRRAGAHAEAAAREEGNV